MGRQREKESSRVNKQHKEKVLEIEREKQKVKRQKKGVREKNLIFEIYNKKK